MSGVRLVNWWRLEYAVLVRTVDLAPLTEVGWWPCCRVCLEGRVCAMERHATAAAGVRRWCGGVPAVAACTSDGRLHSVNGAARDESRRKDTSDCVCCSRRKGRVV